MYDQTHWWFTQMEEARLKARLARLDHQRLLVYAVGCATHSKDVLWKSVPEQDRREYLLSVTLLDAFWSDYPHSTMGRRLSSISQQAETVVMQQLGPEPDQHFLLTPGAEPLLWATLFSLTLSNCEDPVTAAYDTLDRAYYAIYVRFGRDGKAIGQKRMHEIETMTKECVKEVRFQLSFLALLESNQNIPSDYSSIIAGA